MLSYRHCSFIVLLPTVLYCAVLTVLFCAVLTVRLYLSVYAVLWYRKGLLQDLAQLLPAQLAGVYRLM